MKTVVRAILFLLIILWLGGVMFFPVVAYTAFTRLPSPRLAGMVVGHSLRMLHTEGLIAGVLIIIFLLLARLTRALPRRIAPSIVLALIMIGLTAYSQYSVIPRMNHDRIAVGGDIESAQSTNPYRADFDRLHVRSVRLEEGVLLAGVVLVILLAANYPRMEKPRAGN